MQLHECLRERLTDGYEKIGAEIEGSKEDILAKLDRLLTKQDDTTNENHLNLVAGQQDIITTLEKISTSVSHCQSAEQGITAETMAKLLSEQNEVTQLLASVSQKQTEAKSAQLQQLVGIMPFVASHRAH